MFSQLMTHTFASHWPLFMGQIMKSRAPASSTSSPCREHSAHAQFRTRLPSRTRFQKPVWAMVRPQGAMTQKPSSTLSTYKREQHK